MNSLLAVGIVAWIVVVLAIADWHVKRKYYGR